MAGTLDNGARSDKRESPMILVALGANLPGPAGDARAQLIAARAALTAGGARVIASSRLYASAPVPPSDQPDYLNAVVAVETALDPEALLALLHEIERRLGRVRGAKNAARTIDLDLIDYRGRIQDGPPALPHPRAAQRGFVLQPLADVAPAWRDPRDGRAVDVLIGALAPADRARALGSW